MIMIYPSEITKKWPHRPLSEVVDFLDSKRKPITQKDRVPGPYPYYGANGQQDSVADYIFDEPLVLLAEDGGHFGDADKTIAYQVEGKCWVNNHAHVLRPKKDVDIRYICRHLERYDVTPFITGSTRGKLTKTAANNIPIALPPLEEQRRIAAILDKADNQEQQKQVFWTQLEIAHRLDKPVIIHCRDAALAMREQISAFRQQVGKIGGVMHCWTGNPEETQWFLDLGFYISFSGIVTFKNSKTVQAAAQIVPSDRLLIETDCPFLSPNPHRGKPCEPSFVFHVAETVARLRGYPVETLAEQTTQNARNLFQLPS